MISGEVVIDIVPRIAVVMLHLNILKTAYSVPENIAYIRWLGTLKVNSLISKNKYKNGAQAKLEYFVG